MDLKQLLQDYRGSASISRAIPALTIAWILALATFATLKTGALADIPPGWREVFLIAIGPYIVSKAREVADVLAPQKEAPDA